MLKILFIVVLLYLVYHFYLKDIFSISTSGRSSNSFNSRKENTKVDHVPDHKKEYKGGEYIDYEEIK